jgi:hypothetical protein
MGQLFLPWSDLSPCPRTSIITPRSLTWTIRPPITGGMIHSSKNFHYNKNSHPHYQISDSIGFFHSIFFHISAHYPNIQTSKQLTILTITTPTPFSLAQLQKYSFQPKSPHSTTNTAPTVFLKPQLHNISPTTLTFGS